MIYQGYYIQAISFFLIAFCILHLYKRIRVGKMSKADKMSSRLTASSSAFASPFHRSKHLFPQVHEDNFDLLGEERDDDRSLWGSFRKDYYVVLVESKGIRGLLARFLLLLQQGFPLIESIIPFLLLAGFSLQFLLGWPTLMILSVELVNYITIVAAFILLLAIQIPIKAYRNFIRERKLSPDELRKIRWLYFLLHCSQIFRLWSLYWQMKNIVLWLYRNDEAVEGKQAG
jgi:hypothetical protein